MEQVNINRMLLRMQDREQVIVVNWSFTLLSNGLQGCNIAVLAYY
jgi:hypothetical protein